MFWRTNEEEVGWSEHAKIKRKKGGGEIRQRWNESRRVRRQEEKRKRREGIKEKTTGV